MSRRDIYTNTEADAGRYERWRSEPPDDDRPSRSDLSSEEHPDPDKGEAP